MRVIHRTDIQTQNILDFESKHNLDLVITERTTPNLLKYYCTFNGGEVMRKGCLIGSFGNGQTVDEAILDYCKEIEGKTLVFGAYTNNRKEIVVPDNLTYEV